MMASETLGSVPRQVPDDAFRDAVLAGLAAEPKAIPCRFFYDARGSRLFDEISKLPEYYLTRTEMGLLSARAGDMAEVIGPDVELVEFGAGSSTKVRILLDALERPRAFVPIDISGEHLRDAAADLAVDYPALDIRPVVADFTQALDLPPPPDGARRVGFFPGSTIGNFTPAEADAFLRRAARLLQGGGLLIGVDLVKDAAILERAYDDAQGVTAAFNKNLLVRANRELGADFDVDTFIHRATFNAAASRVEMYLVSLRDQKVHVCGETFSFHAGESIHTENSYKYTISGFARTAEKAGFRTIKSWKDPDGLFAIFWLESALSGAVS